jgi:hypothetical protein
MVYRDGRPGYVYLASHPEGFLKIGFSVHLSTRIKAHTRGADSPLYIPRAPIQLECACHGNYQNEQEIHRRFTHHRYGTKRSEWYRDSTEIRQHFTDWQNQQIQMGLYLYPIRRTQEQPSEIFSPDCIEWMLSDEPLEIDDLEEVREYRRQRRQKGLDK